MIPLGLGALLLLVFSISVSPSVDWGRNNGYQKGLRGRGNDVMLGSDCIISSYLPYLPPAVWFCPHDLRPY